MLVNGFVSFKGGVFWVIVKGNKRNTSNSEGLACGDTRGFLSWNGLAFADLKRWKVWALFVALNGLFVVVKVLFWGWFKGKPSRKATHSFLVPPSLKWFPGYLPR